MIPAVSARDRRRRVVAGLMVFEAFTLAVVSVLHLSGAAGGGTKPYNPVAAGVAEAVIGIVLLVGALSVVRSRSHGYAVALAAIGFAIVGFMVGLTFTLTGGPSADVAYHLTTLPILVLTLVPAASRGQDGAYWQRSKSRTP